LTIGARKTSNTSALIAAHVVICAGAIVLTWFGCLTWQDCIKELENIKNQFLKGLN